MTKLTRASALWASGVILAMGGPAAAQEPLSPTSVLPPEEEVPAGRPIHFALTARTTLGFNSEFDDAPGDVTVSRVGGDLAMEIPAGQVATISLGLDYEFSRYDFNDATGFISGVSSPFQDIHRTFFSARYSRQQTRQLVWFAGGSVGISAEEGAELDESIVGILMGGAKFYLSEQLAVGAGAAVATQLEDDPFFFPTLLLEWHFAERWSLVSPGRPGLTLMYRPSEQVKLLLGASYEHRDFRLDRDGPLPGGVALERQIPVSLGIEFQPSPQLQLGVSAGVALARNIELKDSGGREVADIDADPAGFLGFQFVFRF